MPTLFADKFSTINTFKKVYNIDISKPFLDCADIKLTKIFEITTGLKFGKNVCISWVTLNDFFYIKNEVSKLAFSIYINHNWNPIVICWKSLSGKMYEISENEIGCTDIEFWFEGLDASLYIRQLYPAIKIPFELKGLSYELIINRINIDCRLNVILKNSIIKDAQHVINSIDEFIYQTNEKSETKNRAYGVVHNFKGMIKDGGNILFELDLGSAGVPFLKKLLKFMSKMNSFEKVIVE